MIEKLSKRTILCEVYGQTVFSTLFKHDQDTDNNIFEIVVESLMKEKNIEDNEIYARKLSALLTIPLE